MTTSLILACIWLVAANVLAALPSKDDHWRRAYVLIALGLPLLAWLAYENGPWITLIVFVAGASMLRWPVIYLSRWLRRQFSRKS